MKLARKVLSDHSGRVSRKRSRMVYTAVLIAAALFAMQAVYASDNFVKPTPEEMKLTSVPGYPGAAAVVLFREEITKDDLHVVQHYERLKVLTEEGKKYANVELGFFSSTGYAELADDKDVGDIIGRTVHPDGTIIPFTGKPYLKVIEKAKDYKVQQKVFTLPDVTVGSIIEYRYATRYNDNIVEAPQWLIQGDLFVRSAHYVWYPTVHEVGDERGMVNTISWFPILPAGSKIERRETPGSANNGASQTYELSVKDVPPKPNEEYMPPIGSFSYRVLFGYSTFHTADEYWKAEGKQWSKRSDSFIGPNSDLRAATQKITAGAATEDDKLRNIYAAVMQLENTDFTRTHGRNEDKAAGLGKVNNTSDVLAHKRGSPYELTELFIGMARAAGFKSYLMLIPDRSERMFTPSWLSFRQFDDVVAIVSVDGKERFFDPGQRYCPFGQLAWEDTFGEGIRQTEAGTELARTPGNAYTDNKTGRVANLTMDEHGAVTGRVDLTFSGSPALHWRQEAAKGDSESTQHSLTTEMEKMLPNTLEVKVKEIKGLEEYEKPLMVSFDVKGTLGTATGKRLVLPVDLFLSGSSATFPHEKRELAVYFHYPQTMQDALRINFPKNMTLEAAPESSKLGFEKTAIYTMTVTTAPTNVTVRRNYVCNEIIIPQDQYGALRTFYSNFEAKDQDSVILKVAPVQTSSNTQPGAD